jgi:hypothetical protein
MQNHRTPKAHHLWPAWAFTILARYGRIAKAVAALQDPAEPILYPGEDEALEQLLREVAGQIRAVMATVTTETVAEIRRSYLVMPELVRILATWREPEESATLQTTVMQSLLWSTPEWRTYKRAAKAVYLARPRVQKWRKERDKRRQSTPEYKAASAIRDALRQSSGEYKAARAQREQTPEFRAKEAERKRNARRSKAVQP